MRVTFEVAFQALPPSFHRHCTDEAQKAETVQYEQIWPVPSDFVKSRFHCSFIPHKKCGTPQIKEPNEKIVKTLADERGTCARGI